MWLSIYVKEIFKTTINKGELMDIKERKVLCSTQTDKMSAAIDW